MLIGRAHLRGVKSAATQGKAAAPRCQVRACTLRPRAASADEPWPAGTSGTVIAEHDQHKLIEISDAEHYGAMLDMVSETEDRLKLVEKHS